MAIPRLAFGPEDGLLVLSGAGLSAESGIPTFRDANGLWKRHRIEDVATPEGFAGDPMLVWRYYSQRRSAVRGCEPNAGHRCLAALEETLGDRLLIVTQNVDGLHQRAGSTRVIEIHGNLFRTRCSACSRESFDDNDDHTDEVPRCNKCRHGLLRPDVVWFSEALDSRHYVQIGQFFSRRWKRLHYLAVGTSGVVYPAAGLVQQARLARAQTWAVNLEEPDNVDEFDFFVKGRATERLPWLLRTDE